jgi:hypothetical protein
MTTNRNIGEKRVKMTYLYAALSIGIFAGIVVYLYKYGLSHGAKACCGLEL